MTDSTRTAEVTQQMDDYRQEAYRVALALYQQKPDWVTFFRETLGIGGAVRRLFPQEEAFATFEKTAEYNEIQLMLARLRHNSNSKGDNQEPTRVITVRLPKSLHEALQAEAHTHRTSMNKLCITKLLQVIDSELTRQEQEQEQKQKQ